MIWVAEIGSAHNGSKAQAYEMIRQAKLAGATIAKFQFWTEEAQAKFINRDGESLYMRKNRNCAMEWAGDLSRWCNELGIEFMASIWSHEGLSVAESVGMKRLKIAHQITGHRVLGKEFVSEVCKHGKEVFASVVSHVVVPKNCWLIRCSGEYPDYRPVTSSFYEGKWYGYSSHAHGYADALIAVARGAKYIEKHVTLNKADTSLRDNAFALSFEEFGDMVRIGEQMVRLR